MKSKKSFGGKKIDKILGKVEKEQQDKEENKDFQKKLGKLKADEVKKILEKKESMRLSKNGVGFRATLNIYDNQALFDRNAIEQRMKEMKGKFEEDAAEDDGEESKNERGIKKQKSWIQIKAEAVNGRKQQSVPPQQT